MKSECSDLARLYELQDQARGLSGSYDFDARDNPIHLKHLRDVEADLQGLDPASWGLLKAEVAPLVAKKDLKRGWQPLWDKLNEAKGYNHLAGMGCSEVRFIGERPRNVSEHPTLKGCWGKREFSARSKPLTHQKTNWLTGRIARFARYRFDCQWNFLTS
jgi:hypothetical protein